MAEISNGNGEKAVVVRVKRKAHLSPVDALWVEINERPVKRPLLDFNKLSLSSSSSSSSVPQADEQVKVKRVLVQHVDTVAASQDSVPLFHSFLQPASDPHSKDAAHQRRLASSLKHNKRDHLLSKAKQDQQELAKTARFEQIWKRRTRSNDSVHDDTLHDVCRVYDVLRVDVDATPGMAQKPDMISEEDQDVLSKYLPLLWECIPGAAEEIESDISCQTSKQGQTDEFVYDLYTVQEEISEKDATYPFPLVQVNDDDLFYEGPDESDYETDDSNAENNPLNDYPEEESSEEEEKSESSGSESEEDDSETESNLWLKTDDTVCLDRSEDPFDDYEMDENHDDWSRHAYSDDSGDGH